MMIYPKLGFQASNCFYTLSKDLHLHFFSCPQNLHTLSRFECCNCCTSKIGHLLHTTCSPFTRADYICDFKCFYCTYHNRVDKKILIYSKINTCNKPIHIVCSISFLFEGVQPALCNQNTFVQGVQQQLLHNCTFLSSGKIRLHIHMLQVTVIYR